MIDGLKDIYRDFYGTDPGADPADISKTGSGSDTGRNLGIIDTDNTGVKSGSIDPGRSAGNEIEADFVTESEYATQKKAGSDEPKKPEKTGMEELSELIGLETVKHDVKEMIGLARVRKLREEKGMKTAPVSLHLVFSGNPGTGKTTVARILAKLYKEIGILSEGQLVETDRSGLVAGYVGQTAIKTQKKIEEAMGGVLFIDEAYTLNQEGENYGQEAIDTILKAMEDHRDKFIVIVAGYTELMKNFIESNPGLRSRFNKYFEFPDYTADELQQIFMMQCGKYQYKLTDEAEKAVKDIITDIEADKGENFANAREVRNLFEQIITNQATRVADLEEVDEETLTTLTAEDLHDLDIYSAEPEKDKPSMTLEELLDLANKEYDEAQKNTDSDNSAGDDDEE